MVAGSMKCMGSVQQLKTKFGKGYELEIKLVLPSPTEINQFLNAKGMNPGT
jgi:ATP-binding cassette, subfamily A (ABC1), member 3